MDKANCFLVGYITKLHGFKGEVSLFLDVTNPENYYKIDQLFIELNGLLTPFFVESIKVKNNGFIALKISGINNEQEARKLVKKAVYLPDTMLPKLSEKNFYDHEIIGFSVYDKQYGYIGKVSEVIDLPSNPLLQIQKDEMEILLPIQPTIIERVDREQNHLHVNAPLGLIDLYLSKTTNDLE